MLTRKKAVDNFPKTAIQKANQNALLSFDDVCKMAKFSLALGCQISEAVQPIHLPTPDNSELETKMAELERLYHQR